MSLTHYPDIVTLVVTAPNGYGDAEIVSTHEVKATFIENTGWERGSYSNPITSDSMAYIDHEDSFVIENAYRLEEMKLVANIFGGKESQSWYKISKVEVGKRPLLDNSIDNIRLSLDKTVKITKVKPPTPEPEPKPEVEP